jgi:HK97 family phage portal protein
MRAEAIASLRLCCWSGMGEERVMRDGPGIWQAQLFMKPANDWQTRFNFWDTVEESLAYRNNAYIWKNVDPATDRVIEWYALHPNQVSCKSDGTYEVQVADGFIDPVGRGRGKYVVGSRTIIHIRGHGDGGTLEAPTPVQLFRNALAGPVGRQRHEERMWRRGTALQVGIEFPMGVSSQQADEWRESWRSNYEGTSGETTAVVGGGAKITPIGMTAADAQFVDMAKLTVMDASRIMGVPANLLGAQLERSVPNLEQDLATWLRFGLGPECERIESALEADDELFGGAQTYPAFDTQQFVRGDLLSEATILVSLVQAGILTPDEARHTRGLDDLPDKMGAIPQITPVGGAPNMVPMPAVPSNSQNGGGYE